MQILKLKPSVKSYIWGGDHLKNQYNIESQYQRTAEAWVLSAHDDGASTVLSGAFEGKTLAEVLALHPEFAGSHCKQFNCFPLLIKLIDAEDNLSIQVHPSDAYALKNEASLGKTEMWYILSAQSHSFIYLGFNCAVTKEELRQRIENGTVLDVLNKVQVKAGDCFFIEAGTIHAIGSGIIIAEIQQNSNITYRVYDYDRQDKDGNTRELHIEKALDVINFAKMPSAVGSSGSLLASCKYFTVNKFDINGTVEINVDSRSFKSLLFINGQGEIIIENQSTKYKKGDSFFLTACDKELGDDRYKIVGNGTVIVSEVCSGNT